MQYVKLIIAAALLALSFATGWKVKSWQVDSIEFAAVVAANEIASINAANESRVAKNVVKALAAIDVRTKHTYHLTHEITKREIYKVNCIDDAGLAIINGLRTMPSTATDTTSSGNITY